MAVLIVLANADLRKDARFEKMVTDIGLDALWRETSVTPDYRRPTKG